MEGIILQPMLPQAEPRADVTCARASVPLEQGRQLKAKAALRAMQMKMFKMSIAAACTSVFSYSFCHTCPTETDDSCDAFSKLTVIITILIVVIIIVIEIEIVISNQ